MMTDMIKEANTVYYRIVDVSGSYKGPLGVEIEEITDPTDIIDPDDYDISPESIKVEKVIVDPKIAILCYYWDHTYSWAGDGQFGAFNNEDDFENFFSCGSYEVHRPDQG